MTGIMLGIDGYNAEFLGKAWLVIKPDVYKAVQEFLSKGKMLEQVDCTILIGS